MDILKDSRESNVYAILYFLRHQLLSLKSQTSEVYPPQAHSASVVDILEHAVTPIPGSQVVFDPLSTHQSK